MATRITLDGWFRLTVPDDHILAQTEVVINPANPIFDRQKARREYNAATQAAVEQAIRDGYWDVMKVTIEPLDENGNVK